MDVITGTTTTSNSPVLPKSSQVSPPDAATKHAVPLVTTGSRSGMCQA